MSQDNQLINSLIQEVNSIRRELEAIKTQTFVSNSDGTDDAITNPGKILRATGAGQLILAKLGIGVLSPQEILEVAAAAGGRAIFSDGQGSNRKGLVVQSAGTDTPTYSSLESWDYQSSSALGLSINSAGGAIGLGTTDMEDAFLTVAGDALFTSTSNPGVSIGSSSLGYLKIGSSGWYDDGTYFSPSGTRGLYVRSGTPNTYIYSTNIYLGDTSSSLVRFRGNNVRIGENVSGQDANLEIRTSSSNNQAIKFIYGTTTVGEIGVADTTWLRINGTTAKNIYTPRMFRADSGFQVGSSGEDFHVTSLGYVGINKASPQAYVDFDLGGCDLTSFSNGIGLFLDTAGGWARGFVIDNIDTNDEAVAFGGLSGLAYISAEFDQSSDSTGYLARKFTVNGSGQTSIGTTTIHSSAMLTVAGHIWPLNDNASDLGGSSKRWDDVYATNGTIQTSDRRNKTAIRGSKLGLEFLKSLRPVSYKWKNYTRVEEEDKEEIDENGEPKVVGKTVKKTKMKFKRTHYGLIAQEVEEALKGADFAGLTIDGEGTYGLRYNEFISPIILAIQEMASRIEELEGKVNG